MNACCYYYFGSKEQLFTAVLEHAFSALNEAERTLESMASRRSKP